MSEQPPVGSNRQRGAYSRLICLGCRERRIRCELPDDVVAPDPGELRTNADPCYRCKKLGVPCVVRRTKLGRPGRVDGSTLTALTTLPALIQGNDRLVASSAIARKLDERVYRSGCSDVVVSLHHPDSDASKEAPPLADLPFLDLSKVPIPAVRRATEPSKSPTVTESASCSDGRMITAKRVRASKPKVKTGCMTCKIRRIKCDETKPACLKCDSTGRQCDGYPAQAPSKSKRNINAARLPKPTRGLPLSTLKASAGEMRALEYFCVKTAPAMGMYFDHDFWSCLIVRESVTEPAIRHAMAAVGIFAEQRARCDVEYDGNAQRTPAEGPAVMSAPTRISGTGNPVALLIYNTAVGRLSTLASSPGTIDTILLACILFVCIELLRGDAEAAFRHFNSGMAIITNYTSHPERSRSSRLMFDRVRNNMLPFFNRLEMLYALSGNDASWEYSVNLSESVPSSFASLEIARDSLVDVVNLSLRFVRTMDLCRYDSSAVPALGLDEQKTLLSQLLLWRRRLLAYQANNASALTFRDLYACNVLEIQRLVAYTWVSIATTPFETSYDAHLPAFTAAVSLAEQLPALAGAHAQSARYTNTFTMDVEIVGIVHWICIKCRHPTVRRRAMAVLRDMQRLEGMWDSRMAAAIAERVVEIEEACLGAGRLPSEEARVHYSFTNNWSGATSANYSITHRTKPHGVYRDWVDRIEHYTIQ